MKPEQGKPGSSSSDAGKIHRHGRDIVEFSVKGPIGISLSEEHLTNTGCAVLDFIFSGPSQVGELTFRNYYTMWLSILVKIWLSSPESSETSSANKPEETVSDWTMSVPKKILMQHPHYETGSQDMVSVPVTESVVEWKNLVAMRIILRQPSPVWKTFHIEEINVYKDMPRRLSNKESPAESLMMLIKRQTIAALKWSPNSENVAQGAYEFGSLPQP